MRLREKRDSQTNEYVAVSSTRAGKYPGLLVGRLEWQLVRSGDSDFHRCHNQYNAPVSHMGAGS